MRAKRINAVPAPTPNQLNAAALSKVKHPDAPHQAAALEDELRTARGELAEMARLLDEDPEQFDRYFDQVAETGEMKNTAPKVTAKQIPAKKAARSGNPAKKAAAIERPQCSWGVGGDPANGCDTKANGKDGLCTKHRRALRELEKSAPPEDDLPPGQSISVPIVPVPPLKPGAETVEQED
jgi:hypothetical protein